MKNQQTEFWNGMKWNFLSRDVCGLGIEWIISPPVGKFLANKIVYSVKHQAKPLSFPLFVYCFDDYIPKITYIFLTTDRHFLLICCIIVYFLLLSSILHKQADSFQSPLPPPPTIQ